MLKAVKKAGKLGKKVEGYVAKLKQPKQQAAAPTYFIMEEKSARIKCVDPLCSVRIHENDVRALLDEMEVGLDDCISVEHRRYLLYKHDYHSVIFGLGTENVQTCPLCKSIYTLDEGCVYVRCANSDCQQWWCWTCGQSIGDFHTHFLNKHASAGCKLGWKDYDRFLYFIRLLFEINLIGIYTGIFVVFAFSFIYLSNLLFVATIYSLIYRIYKDAHRDTDFLTSVEWIYTILKMTIFGLVGVFVGIPVALSTGFFVGIPIVILYMGIVYIKTNPASRLASSEELLEKFLTYVKWMGRLFGMGLYGRMVDAARKEKKHKKEVAEQRKLVEASERAVRVYKDDFRKERFGDQVFIVNEQNPDQESATNQTPETGNATTPLETSKELNELAIDTAKNRVQSDKQSASNEIDEGDADQSEFGTDANTPGKDKGKKKDDKKSKGKEEGKSKDKKGRKHSKAENNNKKKGADQKKKSDKPEKKESDKPSKATKKDKPRPQQKPKKSSKGPTTSKSKRSSGNKAKKPSKGKK